MDAAYLSKNVNVALTEALTSMAVSSPDDKVEYLGRYLVQYVQRAKARTQFQQNAKVAIELGERAQIEEEKAQEVVNSREREKAEYAAQYPTFMLTFERLNASKQDTMDQATRFIAEFLQIPASYVAIKKVVGETETLHYLSASPGQQHVVGKKITKVVEEGDEVPERQGISFDAFKIPEVPEGEAEEEVPEGEEPPPPKPAPVPLPLIVDNAMREKRCKFFGIPKLGAYAAVPFSFNSIDHDAGCQVAPPPEAAGGEEGEEGKPAAVAVGPGDPYVKNPLKTELIIGIDTIGKYRPIKPTDIKLVEEIGAAMLKVFLRLEDGLFVKQTSFLEAHKAHTAKLAEVVAALATEEAAALAAVEASLAPPPVDPNAEPSAEPAAEPPEPPHEAFKPYKDAEAVVGVWGAAIAGPVVSPAFLSLADHVLPLNTGVNNLFYAVGLLAGVPSASFRDICGDISWEIIRINLLPVLVEKIQNFKPSLIRRIPRDSSLEAVKTFCETNAVLDPSTLPPHLPVLAILCTWLQKAIAAREAAMTYFKDAKEKNLEVFE